MLHKLIRISSLPHILRTTHSFTNSPKYIIVNNGFNRFYGKDSCKGPTFEDKSCKEKQKEVCVTVTSRKHPDDICKGPRRPCLPSPPPYNIGPIKCPRPSQMDCLPKPDCPWDECDKRNQKKYTKHLIIGLIVTALSIFAVWWFTNTTKQVESEKKIKKYKRPKPTCKIPKNIEEIPNKIPYLLIGGGTASFSAFRAIKSSDPTAKVLVISNECYYPYMRPPLSKEMWFHNSDENSEKLIFKQWNGTERSLFYEPDTFYMRLGELMGNENGGVSVAQGYSVERINVVERKAYLKEGKEIEYDKCLIATGGTPKNLDIIAQASQEIQDKVTLYRDIFDFQELDELCKDIKSVTIIGGGFLGSELACALGRLEGEKEVKVNQIFREKGNMGHILPEYLSDWTTDRVRREKVNIIAKTEVEDIAMNEKKQIILHLNNGKKVITDHVVVAIGIKPNTQLATTSDLEIDPELDGFLVNAEMEARSHLYVAGDCSCFYDIRLGRRRVEHHDHAVVSGRLAGENMTGAAKPYLHQSMFWSDLGPKIGYEAIGLVDSRLPTVGVFAKATNKDTPAAVVSATDNNIRSMTEEAVGSGEGAIAKTVSRDDDDRCKVEIAPEEDYGKGVIFYLRNDIVVGILLWNVFNRMSIARQVLKDERKYKDLNEVAKLFNIHEE